MAGFTDLFGGGDSGGSTGDLLGGLGGLGGSGSSGSGKTQSSAAANSIIGDQAAFTDDTLVRIVPWIVGGAVVLGLILILAIVSPSRGRKR